jgi:CRP/FNR family transcriptional regulator, cyclic AMP receptor protein
MAASTSAPAADATLRRTELFRELSEATLAACARGCITARFDPGEMIFGRGDPGDRLYVVARGKVRLSLVTEEGRELCVRIAGEGEMLGEMSTFDGAPRSADAIAMDRVEAFVLTRKELSRQMASAPELAEGVIRFLCRRLRDTTDQLESIALHSIEQRLARLLLAEIGAAGGQAGASPRSLQLPQGELAQLIGASRPKVNIALSALEGAGAFRRPAGGGATQFNLAVLKRIAGLADD